MWQRWRLVHRGRVRRRRNLDFGEVTGIHRAWWLSLAQGSRQGRLPVCRGWTGQCLARASTAPRAEGQGRPAGSTQRLSQPPSILKVPLHIPGPRSSTGGIFIEELGAAVTFVTREHGQCPRPVAISSFSASHRPLPASVLTTHPRQSWGTHGQPPFHRPLPVEPELRAPSQRPKPAQTQNATCSEDKRVCGGGGREGGGQAAPGSCTPRPSCALSLGATVPTLSLTSHL